MQINTSKPTHRINSPLKKTQTPTEPWIRNDDQTLGKNRINQQHTEMFRNKQVGIARGGVVDPKSANREPVVSKNRYIQCATIRMTCRLKKEKEKNT